VPVAHVDSTIEKVRAGLDGQRYDAIDVVLLVDDAGLYQGAADMRDVLAAKPRTVVRTLMQSGWPAVGPGTDQEHAAEQATSASVPCLPVVAENGRPMGCIPAASLLDVLGREHRDDVHRLVGMVREREGARHALEDPPLRRVGQRLPWLLVGLVLSTGGAALMAGFEHALRANIALSFFIPSLVYLTDAIGTQTEAIAVRGLSLRRQWSIAAILASEVVTGGIIGLVLGLLAFVGIALVLGDARLGLGVGLSLAAAGTLASALGLLLPWSLSRLGIDPAFGSGPVATIIQDVLTILVYFLIMAWLLPAG
jgi:magnesium transporter